MTPEEEQELADALLARHFADQPTGLGPATKEDLESLRARFERDLEWSAPENVPRDLRLLAWVKSAIRRRKA